MKLLKSKKDWVDSICEGSNFIDSYWLDVYNSSNENIGVLSGYRINIPLLLNDMLTLQHSFLEFDDISDLCQSIWLAIYNNKQWLRGKNGDLYYLDNLHLDNEFRCVETEKKVLQSLEQKMDVVIYSCGSTELEHPFYNEELNDTYWVDHINMLRDIGWEQDEMHSLFIGNGKVKKKKKYKSNPTTSIMKAPMEHWVKSKGLEWINHLWKGIIQQEHFLGNWSELKDMNRQYKEVDDPDYLSPIHFLRKLKILDYKEFDYPEKYGYEPLAFSNNRRNESLVVNFENTRYGIFLSEIPHFDELDISIWKYDEEKQKFMFDFYPAPFDELLQLNMDDFFIELFERINAQFEAENDPEDLYNTSLFNAALYGPILISPSTIS